MAYEFLTVSEPDNAVARITLAREQKKNALCMAMRDEMEHAFATLVENEAVNAVVLAGSAGIFCAGFDLKEGTETDGRAFLHRFREFFNACYLFPKPMVAAVDGPALAGGFDLALTADFIVASTRAVFGHPEIDFAPVAVTPLTRFVSPARLRELCLLGETIDATTAHEYGIVHSVVEPGTTESAATALAERLAAKPPTSIVGTKKAIRAYLRSEQVMAADGAAVDDLLGARTATYDAYVAKKLK